MNKFIGAFSPQQKEQLSELVDDWTFWNSIPIDNHFYGKNPKDNFRITSRTFEGLVNITKIWSGK